MANRYDEMDDLFEDHENDVLSGAPLKKMEGAARLAGGSEVDIDAEIGRLEWSDDVDSLPAEDREILKKIFKEFNLMDPTLFSIGEIGGKRMFAVVNEYPGVKDDIKRIAGFFVVDGNKVKPLAVKIERTDEA